MPVKVRPQSRMAVDNSKSPAAIPLTIGCNCKCNTCPSGHVPVTTNNIPTTEVSNSSVRPQLGHQYNNAINWDSNTIDLQSFIPSSTVILLHCGTVLWIV